MTICCQLMIVKSIVDSGTWKTPLQVGSRPDSSGSEARIKGASGKISRHEQGLGASKAFAYWQSRHLPYRAYLAQVSSRFPLIHSVRFGPLPLPPSCHPGQDFGLEDPRSPGRFRGPSPFPIHPTSLERCNATLVQRAG